MNICPAMRLRPMRRTRTLPVRLAEDPGAAAAGGGFPAGAGREAR